MLFLTAVGTIGGLTFALASFLVLANRKLHVEEDPRIEIVEDLLPHVNCGACGFPGCRPFAEALVAGRALPGKCTVSSEPGRQSIASFLGVDVGFEERRVARLACAGGTNVARNRARYDGIASCAAAARVAGGGKSCFWGCLGLADCRDACTFDAIRMDRHALPVVDEDKCTACGDCVTACPKDLFSLQPISRRLWVACRSLDAGDELLEDCAVACTACGRCASDAPGLIRMHDNLPVIDYDRPHQTTVPIQRCPTGAIVWIDPDRGPTKGPAAHKIVRQGALRDAKT
ncbi:MAG TPA: RnfABCDGE type electron transport complex subunit B [Candidatus Polarisedimenticolaceae bacterium]|nr:RnfABCDGE type electron transport complex subunit B [Candidatus Polarisedimenticolaceae bacterium]